MSRGKRTHEPTLACPQCLRLGSLVLSGWAQPRVARRRSPIGESRDVTAVERRRARDTLLCELQRRDSLRLLMPARLASRRNSNLVGEGARDCVRGVNHQQSGFGYRIIRTGEWFQDPGC